MTLIKPTNAPCSQRFAGSFYGEPPGWFTNAADGRPLRASGTTFAGAIYHRDFHKGLDLYGAEGSALYAMEAGTVTYAGDDGVGGKLIRVNIRGQANTRYSYDHCAAFKVKQGQAVAKGQVIATMGKTGQATGVHAHVMVEIREKVVVIVAGAKRVQTRWMAYDPARFCLAGSYRMGKPYGGTIVPGGSHIYDDRIYPIRSCTINDGANVRKLPDVHSEKVLLTTAPTQALQVNEVPGGEYEIAGVKGTLWAKVRLPIAGTLTTGYAAKPLIKV